MKDQCPQCKVVVVGLKGLCFTCEEQAKLMEWYASKGKELNTPKRKKKKCKD